MARRKQQRASSGAPGLKTGGSIGPALNPIGLQQTGPGQRYLDATVALEEHKTPWQKFWANEKAVNTFSRPVRSRLRGGN